MAPSDDPLRTGRGGFLEVMMFITLNLGTSSVPLTVSVHAISDYREIRQGQGGGTTVTFRPDGGSVCVTETPAEIDALIAAEQRKRDRLMLAGKIVTGLITNLTYKADADFARQGSRQAVVYADALLAALDATEGAE